MIDRIPFLRDRLDSHMREIVSGTMVAFILKAVGVVFVFFFNVLLARFFGAEGAGVYFLALTVTKVASVIGRLGLDNCLLRFVATDAETNDWVSLKGVYRKGMSLALAASAVCAIIVFIAAPWIAVSFFSKPDLLWPIRLMSFSIVPFSLLTLYAEMLKGLKRIRDSTLIQWIGIQGLSLVGILLVGNSFGINGALLVYVTATVGTCFAAFWLWRSATSAARGIKGHFDNGKMLESSMPLLWSSVMGLGISMAATFILGIWGTKADIGIFGVASRTALLISFLLVAVNSIAAPKFAALYRLGDIEALGTTARSSAKLLTVLAVPVLLIFMIFPSTVMSLFGEQFGQWGNVLRILAIGQFVNVTTGSVGYLLMMSGNERLFRNNIAYTASLNIVLNLLLIPRMGVVGAAIATSVGMAFQNLHAAYLVYRKIKIITIPWLPSQEESLN